MTAVAVVLAGGKGTRSADPRRAKLGQGIAGRSLMEWHMNLLESSEISEIFVVAGHLGDQVEDLCGALSFQGLTVQVIHEAEQKGTVPALLLAAHHTKADEFLVILGDVLMSLPVQQFLTEWRESGKGVGVVVHPSPHPADSDAVFPSHGDTVVVIPKGLPRHHVPNMSSAGLFAMTRSSLERYENVRDIGSNILLEAAAHDDLFAFVSSHYLKDTGTPDRLETTQQDVSSGAFERRGQTEARPALFLDRDGVINPSEPEFFDPSDYRLMPGVAESIGGANHAGVPVIVVTNQPGIAKGFMTFENHQRVRARMDDLLGVRGAFVDDYYFCPHHPDQGFDGEITELKVACQCRKPASGMAVTAAKHHHLDLERSVMVGDTDRDREFADNAGMRFVHVAERCGHHKARNCYSASADAIRRGVEVITC